MRSAGAWRVANAVCHAIQRAVLISVLAFFGPCLRCFGGCRELFLAIVVWLVTTTD